MVLIEFKEATLNRAFEELDEAKKNTKKLKLALCNVEECLCELYESDKEYEDDRNEYEEEPSDYGTGTLEVNYRRRRNMRGNMRHHDGMRMRGYGRYTY